MINYRYLFLTALLATSAFAEVSFHEKKNRVEFLETLVSKDSPLNIDAYRRDLHYEKQKLSLEKRAENEANLLAEKIKVQVQKSYDLALENASPAEAYETVKAAIDRDLQLIGPELQEDIRLISYSALDDAQSGISSSVQNLENLEKTLLKGVKERANYLNRETESDLRPGRYGGIPTAEERNYTSKAQILSSMVSNEPSLRFAGMANIALRSEKATKSDTNVSFQLKADFLGVAIEGGPTVAFRRDYSSTAFILTETLHPVLRPDGTFDYALRDNQGKVVIKDGKPQKRFMVLTCETNLFFETEYSGGGSFHVQGLGGGQSFHRRYANNVIIASRRISLPETIDGKIVNLEYLRTLCHDDFLSAKITNTLTVKDSLNKMMENLISGLRFTHPKTTCVSDRQCLKWYNNELIGLVKIQNVPRCVEDPKEKFRYCDLRGIDNQNCTVYDKTGKRISDGHFEFQCDKGYRCVKVQDGGWFKNWSVFTHAKGRCMR